MPIRRGSSPGRSARQRIWSGGGREAGRSGWRRSPRRSTCWSHRARPRAAAWWLAWTLAASLQVVLPGLYWQHYYLLPTPGHRPGRGHGTGGLPARLDRCFEAEGPELATNVRQIAGSLGAALILMTGHRCDPGDPGSELSPGSPAGADGSLQGRRAVGRAAGPGPRARAGDRASGPIHIFTSGAGKARSISTASWMESPATSSLTTCCATRPSGTIR